MPSRACGRIVPFDLSRILFLCTGNRAGVKDVVLPRLNEPDLDDVPEEVRRTMRFTPVDSADEVLREAFPEQASPELEPEACETGEERPSLQ